MNFTVNDPILGPPRGTAEQAYKYVAARGGKRLDEVAWYLNTLWAVAPKLGIDPAVPFGQFCDETDVGRSEYWVNNLNPAGIRITFPGEPSFTWNDGSESARGHLHRLGLYTRDVSPTPLIPLARFDPHPERVTQAGYRGIATKIADLAGRWAENPNYANQIVGHLNRAGLTGTGGGNGVMPASQDIEIIKEFTPWGRSNRDGDKLITNMGGLHITIHDTGNTRVGTGARAHSSWQDRLGPGGGVEAGVGVTLYVDDEVCLQKFPLDEIAYHAGDGCNDPASDVGCFRSIPIEICVNSDADHTKADRNAAQVIARICLGDPAFDWGSGSTKGKFSINRLSQHIWVSQEVPPHDCPNHLRHATYGIDWNEFMAMVDDEWNARTKAVPGKGPYSRKVSVPSFLKKKPFPETARWRKADFSLINGQKGQMYRATDETPVLATATRRSKSVRRPLTVDETVRLMYRFDANGETWGLTSRASRIPMRDLVEAEPEGD